MSIEKKKTKLKIKKGEMLILFFIFSWTLSAHTWENIGPEGGYFKEFTFHPDSSSVLYAGSDDGGGVWKSSDRGTTWSLLTPDFPNMTGWSIVIDKENPDIIYVCEMYGRYGLLKSTDGGNSWEQKTKGLNSAYEKMVSDLVIKNGDTLFISTGTIRNFTPPRPGNGVFLSYDGGENWEKAGLQGLTVRCIDKNSYGTIFAGTEDSGLWYTEDNGKNWYQHKDIGTTSTIKEIEVKDSVIVVASSEGVFLSTNDGIDFINTGLAGDLNFDINIYKISPYIEIYCSTFSGLKKYSTLTSEWESVSDTLIDNQWIIGLGSKETDIYIGLFSNSPIVKSEDGGTTWEKIPSPFATEINDIYVDPLNSDRIITCLLGTYNIGGNFNNRCIYSTEDGGISWVRKGPKAHALCLAVNPLNEKEFYLGTFSSGLFKTFDTFDNYINLIPGNKLISDVAVSNIDTNVILVSTYDLDLRTASIKRSVDGGKSFLDVSNIFANRLLFNIENNDTIYAATLNGIYISVDNGITWTPWFLEGEKILSIYYNRHTLFAGTDKGDLYMIKNKKVKNISGPWEKPIELKSIYSINNKLFIGLNGAEKDTTYQLNGGIWMSSDTGSTWIDITNSMTSTNIYGNNVITSDGIDLYVGTYGGGIFKSKGLSLGVKESINRNTEIEIMPDYTDNSSHLFRIISKIGITTIKIFNLSGQDVTLYTDITIENQIAEIDISKLPGGTYFVFIKNNRHKTIYKKIYKQ